MKHNLDLTDGSIVKSLVALALPIMGTSFIQMAYSMTDMIWVGRLGSGAVAGVGTAGFFTWLAMAFVIIPKIGAEIGVSQSAGAGNTDETKKYIRCSIQMAVVLAICFGACMVAFKEPLIGFFGIKDKNVVEIAINYLAIVSLSMPFFFMNPVFTGIFNGYGESRTPFFINTIGLISNIVLDPLLIFGVGPFPRLESAGAAIATVLAQIIVCSIFVLHAKATPQLFHGLSLHRPTDMKRIKRVLALGIPVALESGMFTLFTMVIAKTVATWGPVGIAVQKVGAQIEAISWMSAGGFSTALAAFTGQNFGAGKWKRIEKGFFAGVGIVSIIGVFATLLLILGAREVFSIFIQEETALSYGTDYLKILGVSQVFMCWEIAVAGAFNGIGRTVPPSVVGIVFTGLRVPAAAYVAESTDLGLNGIWWVISISSIIKGIILVAWFWALVSRCENEKSMSSEI